MGPDTDVPQPDPMTLRRAPFFLILEAIRVDGVVKSLIYCVVAVFQELDILYYMYSLVPEKPLRLVYEPFYLAPQGHFLRAPPALIQ